MQGNPIDIVTGNKYHEVTDYVGQGPHPLKFKRYYNSAYPVDEKWSFDFSQRIDVTRVDLTSNTPFVVDVIRPNGSKYEFVSVAVPTVFGFKRQFASVNEAHSKYMSLGTIYDSDGSPFAPAKILYWILYFKDTKEIYDSEGKLTQIIYFNGDVVNVSGASGSVVVTNTYGDDIRLGIVIDNGVPHIQSLTSKQGTTIYAYDGWNISQANYPDNTSTTYHYDLTAFPQHLTGLTDRRGIKYANWEYSTGKGRAISSYHADNVDKISINVPSNAISSYQDVTNSKTFKTRYNFDLVGGAARVKSITDCRDCEFTNASFSYHFNGNLGVATRDGVRTFYNSYDDAGNVLSLTEAKYTNEERSTSYEYYSLIDELKRVTTDKVSRITEPSVFTGSSKETNYTYDEFANITKVTISGFELDGTAISRSSTFKYSAPFNQISEYDGPRLDVIDIILFDYYPDDAIQGRNRARLSSVRTFDGIYLRSNITYTITGKIEAEDRANNLHIDYSYYPGNDRLQDMTQTDTVSGNVRITRWSYLATGEVESITEGADSVDSSTLILAYDNARRLTKITDALGNYIEYVLDTEGNVENENIYDASGVLKKTLSQTFDTYNRIDNFIQVNENQNINFNPDGTISTVTDGKSVISQYNYDSLKRLTSITQDQGGTNPATANALTQFTYDVQDNLISVTDANSGITDYVYDDLGNLLSSTSPDTGNVTYTHDAAGNIVQAIDAKNQIFSYTYDSLNRLINIDAPGTEDDVSYIYDNCSQGFGNLCQTQRNNSTLSYRYNAFGDVEGVDQSLITWAGSNKADNSINYAYDAAGRINQITYPSGAIVNYTYNAVGKIDNVNLDQNGVVTSLTLNIEYIPFGAETVQTYGNTIKIYGYFDQAYRPFLTGTGTYYFDYIQAYDENGNIQTSSSPAGNGQNFAYDEHNRLISTNGYNGNIDYGYDVVGNRTSKIQDGVTTSSSYGANSNRLISLGAESIVSDANGNITNLRGNSLAFTTDNRLKTVNSGLSFEYNAPGQRSIKHALAPGIAGAANFKQSTTYYYGQNGELLAEIGPTGRVIKEYIYLNSKPLAMLDHQPSSNELFLRADMDKDGEISVEDYLVWYMNHRSDPAYEVTGDGIADQSDFNMVVACAMTQGSCAAASYTSQIYYVHNDHLGTPKMLTNSTGQAVWNATAAPFGQASVNDDVDGDGVEVEFNIRQPGQYFDVESGLYYNYFRYYDPETGRYITSDPIGLAGGINTYSYVYNNPLNYTDPLGLLVINPVTVNWGFGIAASIAAAWGIQNTNQNGDGSGSGSGTSIFPPGSQSATPTGPGGDDDGGGEPNQCSFGKNTDKKIRKHINQVRNRHGYKQDIPSPGNGGNEMVRNIIRDRVRQGGAEYRPYSGQPAYRFHDGKVEYVIRPNGDFWTILRR